MSSNENDVALGIVAVTQRSYVVTVVAVGVFVLSLVVLLGAFVRCDSKRTAEEIKADEKSNTQSSGQPIEQSKESCESSKMIFGVSSGILFVIAISMLGIMYWYLNKISTDDDWAMYEGVQSRKCQFR